MNLRRLFALLVATTAIIYFVGAVVVSLVAIQGAQRDISNEFNEIIATSVAEMVTEALRLGSFVEARSRIQSFIDKGIFVCADLTYDGTPISKCQLMKNDLRHFSISLKATGQTESSDSILITYVDESKLAKSALKRSWPIISFTLSFGLLFLLMAILVLRRILVEIQSVTDDLQSNGNHKETVSFITEVNELRMKMKKYVALQQGEAYATALIETSKQVSHDIRSPLSALNVVVETLKDLPEDKRLLIRGATQRINDIANDLLKKSKVSNSVAFDEPLSSNRATVLESSFLPALIDVLTSEKRMQFREYNGLEIELDLSNSFGAFAMIHSAGLKRVISNLINNSFEAFPNKKGRIEISVRTLRTEKKVTITIQDNGHGIPKHILSRLGERGLTHGKEHAESGSGLGLFHAYETIRLFGGELKVDSSIGNGTKIEIWLPLSEAPSWFAEQIDLTEVSYFVSLDDDVSIHQIWAGRLLSLNATSLQHIQFQSSEVFRSFAQDNREKIKSMLFLVDYELLNQNMTGLDIIEELGIHKQSILVTSRYEEATVQQRSALLPLKILPKSLAGFVPIQISGIEEEKVRKYDLVLIDDDLIVHESWKMMAFDLHKKMLGFTNSKDMFAKLDEIDLETIFYVDSNLGDGVRGEDVTKKLFELGFKNLYLATGYSPDEFKHVNWVIEVVGKEFPKI